MSDVLNTFDGVLTPTDRIMIFTTNDIRSLDRAFLRPGRIDVPIEFVHLGVDDQKRIVQLYFDDTTGFMGVDNLVPPCDIADWCKIASSAAEVQEHANNWKPTGFHH